MKAVGLAALLVAALGCSVSALDRSSAERTQNRCDEQADCGAGICRDGICQATSSQFDTLLFQVTPPSMSGLYTGVSFREIRYLNQITPGDRPAEIALHFDDVAEITGRVGTVPERGCTAQPGGTLPAKVTFVPTEQFLGLPSSAYSVETAFDAASREYRYRVRTPPGMYDIYVEPDPDVAASLIGDPACRVVSQLFRSVYIRPEAVELPLQLPAPQRLTVHVNRNQEGASLAGWMIDMVDHLTGRLISNQLALQEGGAPVYTVELWYSTASGGESAELAGRELVRLRPPQGLRAPTLLLQRDGLELFTAGEATIDQLASLPPVVTVEGNVETEVVNTDLPEPIEATLTLVATRMEGVEIGSASFQHTLRTSPDGRFSVTLPPGEYRVHTEPGRGVDISDGCTRPTSALAARTETWTVAATPAFQAGRTIQLLRNTLITGRSATPVTDEPLAGATIQAVPSACAQPRDVLRMDAAPFAPRAASGVVCSSDGGFTFSADAGIYDLSVRPPEGTGWPWLVLPTLVVPTPGDLGNLAQPLPVRYEGSVRVGPEQEPVPGAVVRAYVLIDADGKVSASPDHAAWVLGVGETQADETGRFELLLPYALSGDPIAAGMGGGGCF